MDAWPGDSSEVSLLTSADVEDRSSTLVVEVKLQDKIAAIVSLTNL